MLVCQSVRLFASWRGCFAAELPQKLWLVPTHASSSYRGTHVRTYRGTNGSNSYADACSDRGAQHGSDNRSAYSFTTRIFIPADRGALGSDT